MGSVSPDLIQRVKGSLILNPTDLGAASPYGGTVLGSVRGLSFTPGFCALPITAEEWGGAPVDVIYAGESPKFTCVFRSLDSDVMAAVWPTGETGALTGLGGVRYNPGKDDADTIRAGRTLADVTGAVLCFAPRAEDRHPFRVLYNAVPAPEETHEFRMSANAEYALTVVWHALLDDSGRVYAEERREDIAL